MNVLIIAYTPSSATIANQIAENIHGCVHIIQAPKSRQDYWSFLTTKAAEFGADYIIEASANSKYYFKYRNVNDLFYAHEAIAAEDANFIAAN